MPSREDIERFKQVLNSLGSEPAAEGAPAEEPETNELPADISALLGAEPGAAVQEVAFPDFEEPAGPRAPAREAAPGDQLPPLQDMREPFGEEPVGEAAEPEPKARPSRVQAKKDSPQEQEAVDFDFGSLFGDEAPAPPIEDLGPKPEDGAVGPEMAEAGLPDAEAAFSETLPEADVTQGAEPGLETPSSLDFDINSLESLPGDLGLGEAESGPAPAEPFEPAMPGEEIGSGLPDEAAELPDEPLDFSVPASAEESEPFAGIEMPSLGEAQAEEGLPGEALPGLPDEALPGLPDEALPGEALPGEMLPDEALPEEGPAEPLPSEEPPGEALPDETLPGLPDEALPLPEEALPQDAELDIGETAAGPEQAPGGPEGALEDLGELPDDLGLDEFTLPESVEEFGISAKGPSAPSAERQRPEPPRRAAPKAAPGEPVEELGAAEIEIALTAQQFERIKQTLASLPRNLKIAVQDIIAAAAAPAADLKKLIDLLAAGASPQELATLAGRITGKKIRLPAGFEKKTAIAFEAERRTFAYALRENILPVLRIFVLAAAGMALLAFVGYRFVYRPVFAMTAYRTGYEHLKGERFQLANQSFSRATVVWPVKDWFYRYAEGFAGKRQYVLAEQKYEELLRRWPEDKRGILDYARMESTELAAYEKADNLLKRILDRALYDYDALLASGDNDIQWAAEDPKRYEEARIAYASLIEKYGEKEVLLFRMLRYFIRTDNLKEAERLRLYFSGLKDVKIDPVVYAELGGYFVDKQELEYAQDVLFKALEVKADLPEIHYNLARYYRLMKDPAEEKKALNGAVYFLSRAGVLTTARMRMQIDSHTRLGDSYFSGKEYLNAEKEYTQAVQQVEDYQRRKLIGKERLFGLAYHGLGDLAYYVESDFPKALGFYAQAASQGYTNPEMDYKIGYIHYAQGDHKAALGSFATAAGEMSPARVPLNLQYALGNAFYQRQDLFAAQGYYLRILEKLNDKRAGIASIQPQEDPAHRALVENLLKANNNLGVVLFRLSERTGDRRKRSQALTYLAQAAEQYDLLARDPESLKRTDTRSLPNLNTRGILYPAARFEPQVYQRIPKDLDIPMF